MFTAYGKRQLRISQNKKYPDKNSPERFFKDKTGIKLLIFV